MHSRNLQRTAILAFQSIDLLTGSGPAYISSSSSSQPSSQTSSQLSPLFGCEPLRETSGWELLHCLGLDRKSIRAVSDGGNPAALLRHHLAFTIPSISLPQQQQQFGGSNNQRMLKLNSLPKESSHDPEIVLPHLISVSCILIYCIADHIPNEGAVLLAGLLAMTLHSRDILERTITMRSIRTILQSPSVLLTGEF
ncbi:MAG: hypothetical protein EZS28_000778 [Streblomastix strix]|uniref:Uncharacterized protein n=1 Tax=Streblomastix strix TaxID=222440 RepID=A0A5J4X9V6_9EUKA|nr:MAG: hypothetical protein EZS28_000778 [Streblomastix strix]